MVAPPTPQRIPLTEAVDRYLDTVSAQVIVGGIRKATRDNYAADLRNLIDSLGDGAIITDDITGEDVDRAVAKFGAGDDKRFTRNEKDGVGRTLGTQKRFYESVSRFFGHAARHGWVQVSPMPWTTLKPTVRGDLRTERTALTAAQAEALLDHGAGVQDDKKRSHERNYERDKLLLAILVVLGPRVAEIAVADDDDFTRDEGRVVWRVKGKGGKVRKVPLSAPLVALFDAYLEVRPEPADTLLPNKRADAKQATFRSGRGERIATRDIQRLAGRAEARVREAKPGLARAFTPHGLRHTAATLMLAAGWDVKVVSQLLGHASIAATQRYLDEIPGELEAAIRSNPLLTRVLSADQSLVVGEQEAA